MVRSPPAYLTFAMKIFALRKYLLVVMCLAISVGNAMASGREGVHVEKYLYEALPVTGETGKRETVEMEIRHSEKNIHYHAKISSLISREEIRIETDKEGQFVSGTRRVLPYDQGLQVEEKIWRAKDKVFIQEDSAGKLKTFTPAEDTGFAVDGSLLLLLRMFPFEKGEIWKVFMVDFSGHAITVEVHLAGADMITVQAGTFECYRMEVIVGIPLLRPRIVYWLTKDKPHFLVKNIGKRGPFTDTYITTLISRE
ncbi:MAG: DUF3108 domain-containing protein [Syntrophales bacterium]